MMRIGLLAPEVSGKTCYLVGLYGVLTLEKNSEEGYPFTYRVTDPELMGKLEKQFRNLIDETLPLDERFPKKEDLLFIYEFLISDKKSGKKFSIEIIDFPGELLRGAYDATRIDVHKEVSEALHSCDAFIVVIDAKNVASSSRFSGKIGLSPDKIVQVIGEARKQAAHREYGRHGVPIAVCISKYDTLRTGGAVEKAVANVSKLFPDLFSSAHRHPLMIAPISMGRDIDPNPHLPHPKYGGPFDPPTSLATPLEFCLAMCLHSSAVSYEMKAVELSSQLRMEDYELKCAKEAGFTVTTWKWFELDLDFGKSPSTYWQNRRAVTASYRQSVIDIAGAQRESVGKIIAELLKETANKGPTEEDPPALAFFHAGQRVVPYSSSGHAAPLRKVSKEA